MTRANSSSQFKSRITSTLKFIFVVGLLYFLVMRGFISIQATQQALQKWEKIIPAVLCVFLSTFLGVIRWHWLLEAQNIRLGWKRTLQLTLIGSFFNIALPGAVSGDFVKAFYIGKEVHGQRSRAFGSILFDRVAGLSALVLISAGALLFGIQSYMNTPLVRGIQVILTLGASGVIAFYTYLFLVTEKHDPLLKLFRAMQSRVKKLEFVTRIYESLRHYHHHRITVLKALGISVLIQLTVGWACLCFAEALGVVGLSPLSVYVVVPLGLLVTAIPVAPAGIGTGNIAFLYLFHLIGCERGADIYSIYALVTILTSSIGGLVYFRFKNREPMTGIESVPVAAM